MPSTHYRSEGKNSSVDAESGAVYGRIGGRIMVSNQIIEVLNEICNKFGLAIDWTSKNVQPYLQELMTKCVAYKFATSIMWLIFGILVCIIGCALAKMAVGSWKKYKKEPYTDYDTNCFFQTMASGILLTAGIVMAVCNITTMIACKTFPEKLVLDMITKYIKC